MATISASIVTYNSAENIGEVLESLFTQTKGSELTVYVVDNHSSDNTLSIVAEKYPQAVRIPLPDNRGFGYGHNQALPFLQSDYHVIINPDICFDFDVLTELAAYLEEHPEAVIATPAICNPDGSLQRVPKRLPTYHYMASGMLERFGGIFKRWRDEYTMTGVTFDKPTPIDFCTGCFMMIRTSVFKELGGFDDRFFMYCEDADLSRRAGMKGKIMFLPEVRITHEWGRASSKRWKFFKIHLKSQRLYFKKWRGQAPKS